MASTDVSTNTEPTREATSTPGSSAAQRYVRDTNPNDTVTLTSQHGWMLTQSSVYTDRKDGSRWVLTSPGALKLCQAVADEVRRAADEDGTLSLPSMSEFADRQKSNTLSELNAPVTTISRMLDETVNELGMKCLTRYDPARTEIASKSGTSTARAYTANKDLFPVQRPPYAVTLVLSPKPPAK